MTEMNGMPYVNPCPNAHRGVNGRGLGPAGMPKVCNQPGGQGVSSIGNLQGNGRKVPAGTLTAPFPYFGGKRMAAAEIWKRFGPVTSYIEPFAGSLAVLLACPYGKRPREIVNDLDSMVSNFWRAVKYCPDEAAAAADYPIDHNTLIARKKACLRALPGLTELLRSDPKACDPEIAGWWVWCVSNDIGLFGQGGGDRTNQKDESRPSLGNSGAGGAGGRQRPAGHWQQPQQGEQPNHGGGRSVGRGNP